jgi:hypothetical protein
MRRSGWLRILWWAFLLPIVASGQNPCLLPVLVQGKYGLIDTSGNLIIEPRYEQLFDFGVNRYAVIVENKRFGLIDLYGRELIPCREDSIVVLNDSLFAIKKTEQWQLYDPSLRRANPLSYDDIDVVDYGLIKVRLRGMAGMLDAAGRPLIPAQYDYFVIGSQTIITFNNGLVGLYGLNGVEYLRCEYDDIIVRTSALVFFEKQGKYGYLSIPSRMYTAAEWDDVELLEHTATGVSNNPTADVIVSRNDKKGLFLTMNDSLGLLPRYDAIDNLCGEYILFWKNDSCGVLSRTGRLVLPPVYMEVTCMDDGFFKVRVDEKVGVCDLTGRVLVPANYDDVTYLQRDQGGRGLFKYEQNRMMGLVRSDGVILTDPLYLDIKSQQRFLVCNQGGLLGTLAPNGSIIMRPQYDHIGEIVDSVHVTYLDIKVGLLNLNGKELIPAKNDKITVVDNTIKAYRGERLDIVWISDNGEITETVSYEGVPSVHILDRGVRTFEFTQMNISTPDAPEYRFFFSEQDKKWGIRENRSKRVVIQPRYDRILRYPDQWFAYVFVNTDTVYYEVDGCRFWCTQTCGIVDLRYGLELIEPKFIDVSFTSTNPTYWVARVITATGKMGYANRYGVYTGGYAWVGKFRDYRTHVNMGGELILTTSQDKNVVASFSEFISNFRCRLHYVDKHSRDMAISKEAKLALEGGTWADLNSQYYRGKFEKIDWLSQSYGGTFIVRVNGHNALWKNGLYTRIPGMDYERYLSNKGDQPYFVVSRPYKKYGFINRNGELITMIDYDRVNNFSEGMASVMREKKWGFIDKNGDETIPLVYVAANNFREGLAGVKMGTRWGFIDESGDTVVRPQFNGVTEFHEGMAAVRRSGHWLYINEEGKNLFNEDFTRCLPFRNGYAIAAVRSGTGIINKAGEWVIPPRYDKITYADVENDVIIAYKKERYGLIDKENKKITPFRYSNIRPPSEGLMAVRQGARWGFMNTSGKIIIPPEYLAVKDFSCARSLVRKKSRWGVIDAQNRLVAPLEYRYAETYNNDVCIVGNGKFNRYIMDLEGQITDTLENAIHAARFSENKSVMTNELRKMVYVDRSGHLLFDKSFDLARPFADSLAIVMAQGQWGIINAHGQWVAQPAYDSIRNFFDDLAVVAITRLKGVADSRGIVRIQPQYHAIEPAPYGLLRVRKNGEMGYVTVEGRVIWNLSK